MGWLPWWTTGGGYLEARLRSLCDPPFLLSLAHLDSLASCESLHDFTHQLASINGKDRLGTLKTPAEIYAGLSQGFAASVEELSRDAESLAPVIAEVFEWIHRGYTLDNLLTILSLLPSSPPQADNIDNASLLEHLRRKENLESDEEFMRLHTHPLGYNSSTVDSSIFKVLLAMKSRSEALRILPLIASTFFPNGLLQGITFNRREQKVDVVDDDDDGIKGLQRQLKEKYFQDLCKWARKIDPSMMLSEIVELEKQLEMTRQEEISDAMVEELGRHAIHFNIHVESEDDQGKGEKIESLLRHLHEHFCKQAIEVPLSIPAFYAWARLVERQNLKLRFMAEAISLFPMQASRTKAQRQPPIKLSSSS